VIAFPPIPGGYAALIGEVPPTVEKPPRPSHAPWALATAAVATPSIDEAAPYTVCMTF